MGGEHDLTAAPILLSTTKLLCYIATLIHCYIATYTSTYLVLYLLFLTLLLDPNVGGMHNVGGGIFCFLLSYFDFHINSSELLNLILLLHSLGV